MASATNLTYVSVGCFSECLSLGEEAGYSLPSNVVRIEESAFSGCSMKGLGEFPPACEYVGSNAFAYTKIDNLTITNTVMTLEAGFLTNEQSARMPYLLDSPDVYLVNLASPSVYIPVTIATDNYEVRMKRGADGMVNYTFEVAVSQKEYRR